MDVITYPYPRLSQTALVKEANHAAVTRKMDMLISRSQTNYGTTEYAQYAMSSAYCDFRYIKSLDVDPSDQLATRLSARFLMTRKL